MRDAGVLTGKKREIKGSLRNSPIFNIILRNQGIGKMRNCGMRKVKCGIQNAERSAEWWVKRGMRKGQSAR